MGNSCVWTSQEGIYLRGRVVVLLWVADLIACGQEGWVTSSSSERCGSLRVTRMRVRVRMSIAEGVS